MSQVAIRFGLTAPRLRRIILTVTLMAAPLVASACSSSGPGGSTVTTTTTTPDSGLLSKQFPVSSECSRVLGSPEKAGGCWSLAASQSRSLPHRCTRVAQCICGDPALHGTPEEPQILASLGLVTSFPSGDLLKRSHRRCSSRSECCSDTAASDL